MAVRKNQRKRQDRWVEDPDLGSVLELEPIDIQGSVSREVIDVPAIDIQGSRSADVEPFAFEDVPGAQVRREDGVSTMLPEWVPPWATEIVGQPVRGMGGSTEYEVPEWAAELVADSEGQMPTSLLGAGWELGQNLIPGVAQGRQVMGTAPSREARTFSPLAAYAGLADTGSVPLTAAARLAGADNLMGLIDPEAGAEWSREMETTRRQNPGSFAVGEGAAAAAQMAIPGAGLGARGGTLARAGGAALEGGVYGGMEGLARSDAEDFGGLLEDAAIGAGAGAGLSGIMGAGSGVMAQRGREAQRRLDAPTPSERYGDERDASLAAWHQIGQFGADQSQARQRMAVGGRGQGLSESQLDEQAVRTVQQMRDRGIIAQEGSLLPLPREESQTRARAMQEQARGELASILRSVEDEPVDVGGLADSLGTRAQDFESTPGFGSVGSRVREFERDVRSAAHPTVRDLQRWKTLLGQREHFPLEQQSTRAGAYTDVRDALQSEIERLLPGQADQYRDARQRAALGFQLADVTAGDARREGRNRTMGITSYIAGGGVGGAAAMAAQAAEMGGTGTTLAALGGMVAANAANSAFRSVEHGVKAGSIERAAQRLRTNPARFGRWAQRLQEAQKQGGEAFSAALFIAAQEDASVREAMADDADEQQMREQGATQQQEREQMDALFTGDAQDTIPEDATDAELDAFFQ